MSPTIAQALIDTLTTLPPCKTANDTHERAMRIHTLRQIVAS